MKMASPLGKERTSGDLGNGNQPTSWRPAAPKEGSFKTAVHAAGRHRRTWKIGSHPLLISLLRASNGGERTFVPPWTRGDFRGVLPSPLPTPALCATPPTLSRRGFMATWFRFGSLEPAGIPRRVSGLDCM